MLYRVTRLLGKQNTKHTIERLQPHHSTPMSSELKSLGLRLIEGEQRPFDDLLCVRLRVESPWDGRSSC